MDLEKKTSLRVEYYDHSTQEINSWAFKSSTRLALVINTIVYEKDKIDLDKDQFEKSIQFEKSLQLIIWDITKFLNTPYTSEENA
jgi:hypothetical protein